MRMIKPKALLLVSLVPLGSYAEPLLTSWHTANSSNYARLWATQDQETTERSGGGQSSLTTWDFSDYDGVTVGDQPLPVYAGVQGISYTDDYVYIKSSGLATNTMGPWFLDAARNTAFPSFPGNAAILYRFPRATNYPENYAPASRTASNIGTCGLFIDGVPLFNTGDTFSYDTSAGADQEPTNSNRGDGVWNRDAFVNEGITFDAGNAHQAMEQFHYHASPVALRHTLGDSVDYDSSVVYEGIGGATPYTENFNGQHSPILAWANDGLPMYGPYGYSDPNDASSGVRLMVTGYQKRDGTNGSTNLNTTGRTTLPQWVISQKGLASTALASNSYGPNVGATTFTLGHYMEDYAYKGDLGFTHGVDFDLNEYNTRYCVTPEFPEGTWAYFTAVAEDGTPVFPYNLAWNYFGDPSVASAQTEVPADAVVTFEGGASRELGKDRHESTDETVTMIWSGIEGGSYIIDVSTDLENWTTGTEFTATSQDVSQTESSAASHFFRISQTGLATYDETEFGSISAGPGDGGPGGGTPGTGNLADGFVFSFASGPPLENLINTVRVGGVVGSVVDYSLAGLVAGTITISFDDSTFTSGQSYSATFVHTPPEAGNVTETSTNTYTKP